MRYRINWDLIASLCVKIGVNPFNIGRVVAKNVIFNMAAATVLDLLDTSSHGKNCPGTLFSVYVSNLVWIHSKMAVLWPFIWFLNGGRRHLGFCWIRVLGVKVDQGPHSGCLCQIWYELRIGSKTAELLPFNWFQNGRRRHLRFLHCVNFDDKSDCGTQFSTYVTNSVQMRAIMAKLWPKMWFWVDWKCRTWKWRTKLQDMKLQDMKLQDRKLQDMKMPDMKMQDMKMTDQKMTTGREMAGEKSTVSTEIALQWIIVHIFKPTTL